MMSGRGGSGGGDERWTPTPLPIDGAGCADRSVLFACFLSGSFAWLLVTATATAAGGGQQCYLSLANHQRMNPTQ